VEKPKKTGTGGPLFKVTRRARLAERNAQVSSRKEGRECGCRTGFGVGLLTRSVSEAKPLLKN